MKNYLSGFNPLLVQKLAIWLADTKKLPLK